MYGAHLAKFVVKLANTISLIVSFNAGLKFCIVFNELVEINYGKHGMKELAKYDETWGKGSLN